MNERPADGGVRSDMSGTAADLVQARDVSGGIHFHRAALRAARPRQLPGPQRVFVNREDELAALDAMAVEADGQLAVVVGMPGVGKTALVVQWADRNQDRFPDGQLYLNLHGYDEGPPVGPLRVLSGFLAALGVPRSELTTDLDEAAAQYRSVLAGRRVLVVLDNASEASQVRPLLPGGGGCAVIITSRHHMAGLVAREGARRITLRVLPDDDAVALLARLTRETRPGDQPAALGKIAGLCARLPLALRIAAEHAISRPWTSMENLAADLRDQAALWRALTVEDDGQTANLAAARSVFTWSYRALPAEAAKVFRLLAAHPGMDFSEAAVTALTGTGVSRQSLGILVGAHLLEQSAADRYQFHDLVRSYAMDQAHEEESPGGLRDASRRVLLWYLRSADAAQPWVNPLEARVPLEAEAADEQPPESFGSRDEAIRWIETERGNLVAAVRIAAEQDLHEIASKLAVVLRALTMQLNLFDDWLATSEIGLRSAEILGDLTAQAELLQSVGWAYSLAYDLDRGQEYQRRALEIRGGPMTVPGWPSR